MKIWLISDMHCKYSELAVYATDTEGIDMIICAGDPSTSRDCVYNEVEYRKFLDWFSNLPITHKILIGGNHDTALYKGLIKSKEIKSLGITYLNDETVTIEGVKIFGSPWTPTFGIGWGFNCNRDRLHKHWSLIEEDTDIVVTHGPPRGYLDNASDGFKCGCAALRKRIKEIRPKYHVFGHIHEEAGRQLKECNNITTYINASIVDLRHNVINNGQIINYER